MEAAVFCIYCGTPVRGMVLGEPPTTPRFGRMPLKSGKGHGIRSLVWGVAGWLASLALFSIPLLIELDLLAEPSPENLWFWGIIGLAAFSLLSAIAGIIYGILGYNTEGWRYACAGFVLSALLVPVAAVIAFIVFIVPVESW